MTTFRTALALVVALTAAVPAQAGWRPNERDSFDIQLSTPFQFGRKVAVLAMGAEETSPTRLQELQARGVRTLCVLNAGAWENWRADSGAFDKRLIGLDLSGWSAERWFDIRALDALTAVMARRLDLCRDKGFDGVLLRNLDGYRHRTGFTLTPADQLTYNRALADAARARGLAVGLMNPGELSADLVASYDFAVSEGCIGLNACGYYQRFREADKAVYVVEYTNLQRKMEAYCQEARELDVQLIFKTKFLNGKLHDRCP